MPSRFKLCCFIAGVASSDRQPLLVACYLACDCIFLAEVYVVAIDAVVSQLIIQNSGWLWFQGNPLKFGVHSDFSPSTMNFVERCFHLGCSSAYTSIVWRQN